MRWIHTIYTIHQDKSVWAHLDRGPWEQAEGGQCGNMRHREAWYVPLEKLLFILPFPDSASGSPGWDSGRTFSWLLFDHVWRFLFKVVFLSCLNYHSLILITPCQLLRKFWSREEATFAGQAGVGRVTDAVTHHSHPEFPQACLSTWAGDDVILQCFSAGAQNILTWAPRTFQKGHR